MECSDAIVVQPILYSSYILKKITVLQKNCNNKRTYLQGSNGEADTATDLWRQGAGRGEGGLNSE